MHVGQVEVWPAAFSADTCVLQSNCFWQTEHTVKNVAPTGTVSVVSILARLAALEGAPLPEPCGASCPGDDIGFGDR